MPFKNVLFTVYSMPVPTLHNAFAVITINSATGKHGHCNETAVSHGHLFISPFITHSQWHFFLGTWY